MYKMKINIELNNNNKIRDNQIKLVLMLNYIYLKKQFKLIKEQKKQNNLIIVSIVFWN